MQRVLNKEQREAVQHGKGPLLIIAGAGTGKTTVVTERIKYLILKKGAKPSEVLALTFTEKAAAEMQERIDVAMPYGYSQMWISTFHAFCDRILRAEAIHIGLNPSYKLMTEAESILFLRKHLSSFQLDYFRPLGNPYKFLQGMLSHFSRLKDEDISTQEYLSWAKRQKEDKGQTIDEIKKNIELAEAFRTYEDLKAKEGVMDFSDLITNTLKLFRTRKNILKNYQEQFTYILVDEFQDTNYSQNVLAVLLTSEKKNITVVGDDDQAIYRWRGAAISNIIQFRKQFKKIKIITLTKNYRSTEKILNASYTLIQNNNPDRLEVKEKIDKKLVPVRGEKGKEIEFLYADRVENEAEMVVKKIKELTEKNISYKEIALLVRANDYSKPFIRAFERNKIPYQFLGPARLFHQEEIKDLIAYLKVLYNFEDSSSLYRVLTMPIFQLESIEVAVLLNLSKRRNYTLFESLEKVDETFLKDETKEKIKKIAEMIKRHITRARKDTAGQILYYFLQDSGLLQKIIHTTSENDEKMAKSIAKFFDRLKTYEIDNEDASLFAVVDWIELSMQMGESPLITNDDWTENNAVNILTIHSSKGLEFPAVFITNLVTQRFPSRERKEQLPIPNELIKEILPEGDFHLEEERRLCYVGMTRARDYLFLTAANFYGEGKRERKISPFAYEALGEKIIERELNKNKAKENDQLSLLEWTQESETPLAISYAQPAIPITYLSYSQMQTFEICPLHYKLRYLLKIPTFQTASQSFGTSIHSTLRDYYQKIIDTASPTIDDAFLFLEKNWINEGYASRHLEKEAFEKAKRVLKEYLDNNDSKKTKPLALELPFQFFLKGLKVAGKIDRIDLLKDGRIEILDYKTGTNMPDEKNLAEDKQLTFYALAATEVQDKLLGKKPEEVVLSLYYLEKGKKLTTTRTKEQLEKAKESILQKVQEISTSEFLCSGSIICKDCEYKILCSMQ